MSIIGTRRDDDPKNFGDWTITEMEQFRFHGVVLSDPSYTPDGVLGKQKIEENWNVMSTFVTCWTFIMARESGM